MMFPELPAAIVAVLTRVKDAGGHAFVVGGAVRDLLMGQMPEDWDLAATLPYEALAAAFPGASPIGGEYGTLRLSSDSFICDITPCRSEEGYADRRHPDRVRFHPNILMDLARRDFTVNAMAYDGVVLLDPFGGQKDLECHVLRCVGDPVQRFEEDPLRILRLFRFSATLDFTAEWNTFSVACDMVDGIASLSRERVYDEVVKILLSDGPQVLGPLIARGGLCGYGFAFAPSLASIVRVPRDLLCRWWALISLCGADPEMVGDAFGFSRRAMAKLVECINLYRMGPARDKTELKHKIRNTRLDYRQVAQAFAAITPAFAMEPVLFGDVEAGGEPYRVRDLAVNGDMLLYEGIKGERCGRVLDELLSAVINDPELNDTQLLLGMARGLRQLL